MARINKNVQKKMIWRPPTAHWKDTFFMTRLSRRQIRKIEATGREVIFGRCFNCGWREAIYAPGKTANITGDHAEKEYPRCRRCRALWERDIDTRIEDHA